jgi:uncharacterized OB-fold protein
MNTSLIRRHYEQLRAGKLVAHKCACGTITFPITSACQACGSTRWQEIALSGKGTLHFASNNVAPPPHPRFASIAPYVYGHIVLDEGVTTQAIIKGVDPAPPALERLFQRGPTGVTLDVLETQDLPVMAFRLEKPL